MPTQLVSACRSESFTLFVLGIAVLLMFEFVLRVIVLRGICVASCSGSAGGVRCRNH